MGNARSSAFRRDHSGLRNVVVSQQRGSGCWKAPYFDLEVPPPSVIVPHPIPDSVYRSKLREASDALSANYNATKGRITFFMVVGFTLPIIINIVPLVEGGGGYGITGGETRSIAFAVVGSIFIFTGIFMIVLRQRKIAKAMKDIFRGWENAYNIKTHYFQGNSEQGPQGSGLLFDYSSAIGLGSQQAIIDAEVVEMANGGIQPIKPVVATRVSPVPTQSSEESESLVEDVPDDVECVQINVPIYGGGGTVLVDYDDRLISVDVPVDAVGGSTIMVEVPDEYKKSNGGGWGL